jgi:hypothetical protein
MGRGGEEEEEKGQITLNDQPTEYVSTFKNVVHNIILNHITDFKCADPRMLQGNGHTHTTK